jgi:UDP-N-acetylmuramoyl-L-alanyl-D-glutamate--2,6-diaminopimelate ligase
MHSIMMPDSTARVVVDYAHTPDALENALKTLKPVAARLGVVFGCGGERDKGKRAEMGAIAAKMADSVIVTNDNPRREDPENIRQDILTACPHAENISDRGKAIEHGMAWLKDGDILLIAGKGHEDHQLIGDETLPFSDEGTVRAILRAQMAGGQQ